MLRLVSGRRSAVSTMEPFTPGDSAVVLLVDADILVRALLSGLFVDAIISNVFPATAAGS